MKDTRRLLPLPLPLLLLLLVLVVVVMLLHRSTNKSHGKTA